MMERKWRTCRVQEGFEAQYVLVEVHRRGHGSDVEAGLKDMRNRWRHIYHRVLAERIVGKCQFIDITGARRSSIRMKST